MAVAHAFLPWPTLAISGTAFLLGCRHAFDWDHLAAITDLTAANQGAATGEPSTVRHQGRRLGLAFWYCIGHGSVIALLGFLVAVLGLHLPSAADHAFESIVGATLLALGAFVLWQLGRDGRRYRYSGRVRVLVGMVRRTWARARRRGRGPVEPLDDLTARSAFAVGVVHGTGAETPTQVVLFAGAATSGSKAAAVVVLASFVLGMVVADVGVAATWLAGLLGTRNAPRAQIVLGLFTALSSLVVGALFLSGQANVLPSLLGG